jgi:Ca-activated chloride channel family protein
MNFAGIEYLPAVAVICTALLLFLHSTCLAEKSFEIYHCQRKKVIAGDRKRIVIKEILIITAVMLFLSRFLNPSLESSRVKSRQRALMFLLPLMSAGACCQRMRPHRLDRAKRGIKWIAESLSGDRIGLMVFAGDAFLLCPLTNDIGAFMSFLILQGLILLIYRGLI